MRRMAIRVFTCIFVVLAATAAHAIDYTSAASGNWNSATTWTPSGVPGASDNATVLATHVVSLTVNQSVGNLTVNAGGTVDLTTFTLASSGGTVTVDGSVQGIPPSRLQLNAITTLSGLGQILSRLDVSVSSTVAPGSVLTVTEAVINNPLTNNGDLRVNNTLFLPANFFQGTSSILRLGGSVSASSGIIDATATGNLIEYFGGSQLLNGVFGAPIQYFHLKLSGTGTKSLAFDTVVNGMFDMTPTVFGLDTTGAGFFRVNGSALVHGSVFGTGSVQFGPGSTLGGQASFGVPVTFLAGLPRAITPGANHQFNNGLTVNGGVQNDGAVTTFGIGGTGAWTQGAGSLLITKGDIGVTTFNAAANPNVVRYQFGGSTSFLRGATYHHLEIADGLTMNGNTTVNGLFQFDSDEFGSSSVIIGANTLTVNGPVAYNAGSFSPDGSGGSSLVMNGPPADLAGGSYANVTINKPLVNIFNDLFISNTLTLTSGVVATAGNVVGLKPPATYSRVTGFVAGNFRREFAGGAAVSFTYPLGTLNYTPVTIAFPSSSAGEITASVAPGDHPAIASNSGIDPAKSVNLFWTLTGLIGFPSLDVTFNYPAPDIDMGANPLAFLVGQFNGINWSRYSTFISRTSNSIQLGGLTTLGSFAVGEAGPIFFTSVANGSWQTPTTWSPTGVPGTLDFATIDGETVTVDSPTVVDHLSLDAGLLAGSAPLGVVTAFSWTGGDLGGAGIATLDLSSTCSTTVTGTTSRTLNRTINNNGTFSYSATGVLNHFDGTFNNLNDLDVSAGAQWLQGTNGSIVNSGDFLVSGAGAQFTVPVTNNGNMAVIAPTATIAGAFSNNSAFATGPSTTLTLSGGGTSNGTFAIDNILQLTTATFTFNGASFSGPGLVEVNGATVIIGGTVNAEEIYHRSGLITGGSSILNITRELRWEGGDIGDASGTINLFPGSNSTIEGPATRQQTRTFNNGGTLNVTSSGQIQNFNAVFTNGGTFNLIGDPQWLNSGASFVNNGSFHKQGGTGTTVWTVPFTNNSVMELATGFLDASGGVSFQSGSTLAFPLGGTSAGSGYGQLILPATSTFAGALNITLCCGFDPPPFSTNQVVQATTPLGNFSPQNYPTLTGGKTMSGTPVGSGFQVSVAPQTCTNLPSGAVAWYRADNSAGDSTGTNHGTFTANTYAAGQVGQAFSFDGSITAMTAPDAPALRPLDMTVEGWINFSSIPGGVATIASKTFGTGTGNSWSLYYSAGTLVGLGGTGMSVSAPFNPTPGVWYHVGYTAQAMVQQLFINGVQVNAAPVMFPAFDSHPLVIGAEIENETFANFFPGLIDELTIYNRGLSSGEILSIFNSGPLGKCYTPSADLTITKVASAEPVLNGQSFTYTLTVTNNSITDSATSIVVDDPLNPAVSLTDTSGPGWMCSFFVNCTLASLAPGASSAVTLTVTANTPATFTNTATVSSAVNDPNTSNNSAAVVTTIQAVEANLALTAASTTAPPATYPFTVTNNGPFAATNVQVVITLPAGQTYSSATGATCSGTGTVTCSVGSLAVGASQSAVVTVTTGPGSFQAAMTASANESDPNLSDNQATGFLLVTSGSVRTVTSSASSGPNTLDQAILDANDGSCIAPCTINFAIPTPAPIVTSGFILNVPMLIDGNTQPGLVIDGSSNFGVFDARASSITIRGLTIQNAQFGGILAGNDFGTFTGNTILASAFGVAVGGVGNRITGNTISTTDPGLPSSLIGLRQATDASSVSAAIAFNFSPTPNDPGDADTGPNNLQNSPVLGAALFNGSALTVEVSVDSSAVSSTAAVFIELFKLASNNLVPVGSGCLAGNNFVNQSMTVPGAPVVAGDTLYATATSFTDGACTTVNDGTSEVSAAPATVNGCTLPPPPVTPSGPTTFCTGGSVTLTAPLGFTSYTWSTGATTRSILVSATGSYSVTVTDDFGCSAISSPTVVTVNPPPTATVTASGPTKFCSGGSVTLTATAGMTSYAWSNGATTPSIVVTSPGNYSVTVTNSNGCSAVSAPATVIVDPAPVVDISGPTSTCRPGDSVTLTAGGTAISTYLWSTGATTPSITVNPTTSTSYSVTVTSSAGCTASASTTIAVGVSTSSLIVDAPQSMIAGATATASVAGASTGSFTWSIANGAIVSGQGSPSITFTAGPSGNVVLVVTTTTGACSSDGSASVTIIACTTTPSSLIAPADGATDLDSPVTFSWTSVPGATSYELWIGQGGDAPAPVASTVETTLTRAVPSGAGRWFVIARLSQACGISLTSSPRTFTVKPLINCPKGIPTPVSPLAAASVFSPVTFRWEPVTDATGYHVVVISSTGAIDDLGVTEKTSLLAPVAPGNFSWQVEALFDGCPPNAAAPVSFTVDAEDCASHGSATLTAPSPDSTTASASVNFAWTAVEGADGYRVWIDLVNDDEDPKVVGETADTKLSASVDAGLIDWFVETLFEGCASTESAHALFTVPAADNCGSNQPPALISPAAGITTSASRVTFSWSSVGALQYELYLSVGNGTPVLLTRTTETSFTTEVPRGEIEWYVRALFNGCPALQSASQRFTYEPPAQCTATAPSLIAPLDDTFGVPSPLLFRWSAVPGATQYRLRVQQGPATPVSITTTATQADNVTVPNGVGSWSVEAMFAGGCPATSSSPSNLVIIPSSSQCIEVGTTILAGPSQISPNVPYTIVWRTDRGATEYVLQESISGTFADPINLTLTDNFAQFTHTNDTSGPVTYFYRVRGVNTVCSPAQFGAWSETVAVVVLPKSGDVNTVVETAALISQTQVINYTIPLAKELAGQSFSAVPTKPWISVTPTTGTVSSNGTSLEVSADTRGLPLGTSVGGVVITLSGSSDGRRSITQSGTTGSSKTTPVNVSLVTPNVRNPKSTPPPDALIIPAVAHADGVNTRFQSDVRVTNTSPQVMRYQLTFTPTGETGITDGRQTTMDIEPGRTVALDDVLRTWFGTGTTSVLGTLEIRPLTKSSSATSSAAVRGLQQFVTFASSRTFNVTSNGTFGQHIPAVPFANFIGRAANAASSPILSLQQIAQSSNFRTNLGLVEGSGTPASLLVSVFGDLGQKMTEFGVNLTGGQHLQLGSILAQKGVQVNDGRIEVRVTSPGGKVTAYASVLDNRTNDSLLVTPVALTGNGSTKFVLPGVAELSGGIPWQTDARIFNASAEAVTATVTFQSLNSTGDAPSATLTFAPNEVKKLDRVLLNMFGITNDGGALHISTANAANLIATARTYRPDGNGGTFGQFIQAVTPNEAVSLGSRPLQLLQIEQSERLRSNLGLAEVTGQAALVEVTAVPPDSKVSPVLRVQMAPNQFRQLNSILQSMGLSDTHNARITVKVIQGQGRVTAYASVIDSVTADPTFVPAQ